MPATNTDLSIEAGTDWSHGWRATYNGTPIDSTWTARSQVRHAPTSPAVLHEFATAVNDDGSVVLAVSPGESSLWSWRSAAYDVVIENEDGSVTLRLASGTVSVSPGVTRNA